MQYYTGAAENGLGKNRFIDIFVVVLYFPTFKLQRMNYFCS